MTDHETKEVEAGFGLRFSSLAIANHKRVPEFGHDLEEWSETDWMTAIAGEVGEAANLIKKRRRGEEIPRELVEKELADVVIYLDLLAQRMGFRLGDAVEAKFNEVSDRIGSSIKLKRRVGDE